MVQLSDAIGPTEVGVTPMTIPPGFVRVVPSPSHFSFESVPLSQWLPSHFFSLGPWTSPNGRLRDGPLSRAQGLVVPRGHFTSSRADSMSRA